MSQNDDKVKSPPDSSVNTVPNPENNKANITIPDTEAVNNAPSQNWVNTPKSQEIIIPNVRENMVIKATEFLRAGKHIQNTPMDRKVEFLRSKGLTDQEIHLSFQRASAIDNFNQNRYNTVPPSPVHYNSTNAVQEPVNSQSWFKRLIGPMTFGVISLYLGYEMYKKYIEKWLFNGQKSQLESRLEAVEASMQRCIALSSEVRNNITDFSNEQIDRQRELDQIRTDLKSIKSLLLNRNQFPPAPVSSSIPHWQLAKAVKLEPDQMTEVNGKVTLNSSLPNIGVSSTSFNTIPNALDGEVIKENSIKHSTPNGATTSMSYDQNITQSNNGAIGEFKPDK